MGRRRVNECRLSIVIPVLNEAPKLPALLASLQSLRQHGELIVVDGGSTDGGPQLARGDVDQLLEQTPERASQLMAGVRASRGRLLWMLHADTVVSEQVVSTMVGLAARHDAFWGRFDVRLDGEGFMFGIIGRLISLRSRWSGIATGDQGIFVSRTLLDRIGGIPQQALMEDVELSKRLRAFERPHCRREQLITSCRRWRQHGTWRTIWLMWALRWRYFRGADPQQLAEWYK